MDILIVSLTALLASALTLFSGFGLGTLLMPVVALFFPAEIAIAITAIVHFANNIFKLGLLGKNANKEVLLRFGIPAILASFTGASILTYLAHISPLYSYALWGKTMEVTTLKLVIGSAILAFVSIEMSSKIAAITLDKKYLPVGGIISGFFGGLSGHQGALRSMFLIKAGLAKEQFIATGVMLAVMIDLTRLSIYGWNMSLQAEAINWTLVISASLAAFIGAYLGAKLMKKITIKAIQMIVSVMLSLVGVGLIAGVL